MFHGVWVVMVGSGGDLGGQSEGRPDPTLCARDRAGAEVLAKGRGWYGSDANVRKMMAVTMPDGRTFLLADATPVIVSD